MSSDRLVICTADDAILAKQATTKAGYYDDEFLEPLAEESVGISSRKQFQPIIKKGTHARVACVDRAIDTFLEMEATCQVVVLGAGKDTAFYRHVSKHETATTNDGEVAWMEVDFDSVMRLKATTLRAPVYQSKVSQVSGDFVWKVQHRWPAQWSYSLVGHDLRESPQKLLNKLTQAGFVTKKPTLFVVECVQMYMPRSSVTDLWAYITQSCPKASAVLYEPIVQDDRFGSVMEQHMLRAGVATPSSCLVQTRTLLQQASQLLDCGFHEATGCSMWSAYQTILTDAQRQRATIAEFLDEVEEWRMIMEHYCIVVAVNHGSNPDLCRQRNSPVGFQEKHSLRQTR